MTGSSAAFNANNGGAYNLSGGSGCMSGGSFSITGVGGTIACPVLPSPGTVFAPDSGTHMTGSGSVGNIGDSVSGTYYIDSVYVTGWNIDGGTFSGSRTQ
jgi:hypothetical protein